MEGLGSRVFFRGLGFLCVLGFCKRRDNVQSVPPRNAHVAVLVVVGKRLQLGLLGMLLDCEEWEREREREREREQFAKGFVFAKQQCLLHRHQYRH